EPPELEVAEEIAAGMLKLRMRLVSRLTSLRRTFPRILGLDRRGDHEDLRQHPELLSGQDHPPDAWVDRHAAELPTDVGQFVPLVDRAEFPQRAITLADRILARRIDQRKLVDRPQPQRQRLQDDRSEVGAADFGRGEGVARLVIFLRKESYADPRRDAPAAAG